jgi:methionine synthase I (cobalamin-dependent)/5,10-methylenetetrahydrofolate reductase
MQMSNPFLERLRQGPILCDGAMGTRLYEKGVSYERCFEQLNLTDPELIKTVHLEYIAAGAEIIETNTFGANRYRLAEHGLEDKVRQVNRAGAKIAREASELSDVRVFLAGDIGPLGSPLAPLGNIQSSEARDAFLEQTEALLQAGVDLFIVETMSDLEEMRIALEAIRSVTNLPVVALMTFGEDSLVASGEDPCVVAQTLHALKADIVGVNCALGPSSTFDVVQSMCASQGDGPASFYVGVQPNAGLPRRVGSRFIYVSTPDYFAEYTRRFLNTGVRLIGGCCGTTPQHIAAMKKALIEFAPASSTAPITPQVEVKTSLEKERVEQEAPDTSQEYTTGLARLLSGGKFPISVEMRPPRSVKFARFLQNAAYLREQGVDVINIPDNAMALVRMNNIAAARLVQERVGVETIVHFTPRDRNLMAVQSDVIGAHASEVRNILAVTGDPPSHGDFPNATSIWDVDSIGVIAILNNLNQGLDGKGRKLAAASSFYIGCAATPTANDIDLDIERLSRKIEAGAHFIMTQPVYEAETLLSYFERYRQRFGPVSIPILVGLQPLHSYQQAEKFHNEVPGIIVPAYVRERLRLAGEASAATGVEIIKELFESIYPHIQGVYLMPLDRYTLVSELIPFIRERTQASIQS